MLSTFHRYRPHSLTEHDTYDQAIGSTRTFPGGLAGNLAVFKKKLLDLFIFILYYYYYCLPNVPNRSFLTVEMTVSLDWQRRTSVPCLCQTVLI